MRDPESVWMAAFTTSDPDDRRAFDARLARLRSSPGITVRAVTRDGQLAGSIASFVIEAIPRSPTGSTVRPGGAASRAGPGTVPRPDIRAAAARPCGQRQLRIIERSSQVRLQGHPNRDLLRPRPERRHRGNDPAHGLAQPACPGHTRLCREVWVCLPSRAGSAQDCMLSRRWRSSWAASSTSLCRHSAARYWHAMSPMRWTRRKSP
jgi:hypothetical protein